MLSPEAPVGIRLFHPVVSGGDLLTEAAREADVDRVFSRTARATTTAALPKGFSAETASLVETALRYAGRGRPERRYRWRRAAAE
ncbi:hypothetical protein [Glycomyces salinus]|uniref:hypothetical protein n=1 Tax=Glycomyces salinus TaxID=980294 RepID=UPI0018EB453A|nr:hypothetical protein [Glycomyces salinus]